MKLSIGEAAKYLGVSVVTLRRWHRNGKLIPQTRTLGGHRRYDLASLIGTSANRNEIQAKTIIYARVSSHEQKADLERQAESLRLYCEGHGWSNPEVIKDLGSGLNYKKKGLGRLLNMICSRQITRLVVQSKDRLLRFGAEIIFTLCKAFNIIVEVVNPPKDNFENRLAEDVIELMTVFSARLYGSRSHKNKKLLARNKANL